MEAHWRPTSAQSCYFFPFFFGAGSSVLGFPPLGLSVFHQSGPLWSLGWHTGYDYVVPSGTDILATYNGTITSAGWAGAW